MWRLKTHTWAISSLKKKSKEKKKKSWDNWKKEAQETKAYVDAAKVVLRGKFIAEKKERIQPNLTLQGTRRWRTK